MTHTITEQELDEWLRRPQWQIFASSASGNGVKRLEVDGAVFRVVISGETAFLGTDKAGAVATYNGVSLTTSEGAKP